MVKFFSHSRSTQSTSADISPTSPSADAEQLEADSLEHRVEQLEKRVKALERQVEKLKEILHKDSQQLMSVQEQVAVSMPQGAASSQPSVREHEDTQLYLSAPTPDGIFTEALLTEQVGKSIYQLTTTDGVNGHFVMLSTSDAIATAMLSVSQMVKPVCRIVGNTAAMPHSVATVEDGKAVFVEGQWRMTHKAIVRFE